MENYLIQRERLIQIEFKKFKSKRYCKYKLQINSIKYFRKIELIEVYFTYFSLNPL